MPALPQLHPQRKQIILLIILPAILLLCIFQQQLTNLSLSTAAPAKATFDMSPASTNPLTTLKLKLRPTISQLTSSDSLHLQVTVKNPSPDPLTILTWNTPLDPSAGPLGLFHLTPVSSSGEPIHLPSVKLNRKLPPDTSTDFVEIPANGGEVVREIQISAPMIQLALDGNKGKYRVEGSGHWGTGVWKAELKAVGTEELEGMKGDLGGVADEGEKWAVGGQDGAEVEFV